MSHRDRTDLGTHLSRGENRGSYVRATDLHLSLRSFRDNNSQSTLPPCDGFVNEPAEKSCEGKVELAGDLDAPLDGAGDGATSGVDLERPFYFFAVLLTSCEVEYLPYALEDENLVLRLYLPHGVGVEVIEGDLTRCQRAPEGAEQSAARCGYQVIQSRAMRFLYFG